MADYTKLVRRLASHATSTYEDKCDCCPYPEYDFPPCVDCLAKMQMDAARAIEELQAEVQSLRDAVDMYGGEAGITQVFKEREELRKRVPKWISVEERLPDAEPGDVSEQVLVTDGKAVAIVEWFNFEECEPFWGYTGFGKDVTHWMPLPEPPKEERKHG